MCFPIRTTRVRRSVSARETFSFCIRMVRSKLRIPQENNTRQNGCQETVGLHLQQNASELIETIYTISYRLSENDLTRRRPHVGLVEEVVAPTATEPDCAEQAARWRHCLDCNESCDEGLDLVKPGEVSNYPLRYTDCARATGNPSPIVVERWRMNRAGPGHVSL